MIRRIPQYRTKLPVPRKGTVSYKILRILWKIGKFETNENNYASIGALNYLIHLGYLADCDVYKETEIFKSSGIASENTLLVLGLEESHRRNCKSFDEYLKIRPD